MTTCALALARSDEQPSMSWMNAVSAAMRSRCLPGAAASLPSVAKRSRRVGRRLESDRARSRRRRATQVCSSIAASARRRSRNSVGVSSSAMQSRSKIGFVCHVVVDGGFADAALRCDGSNG